jgi:hypothetical protein
MKSNVNRAMLGFGIFMSIVFTLLNLYLDGYSTSREIIKAISIGLIMGALAGVCARWLLLRFIKPDFANRTTAIGTMSDETILFETPANHFKGMEGVGGKLHLTNLRLVFKSHKLNFQNHELSIKLTDIESVDQYKTLGLVNNGLSVITIDHNKEKFVVEEVGKWLEYLSKDKKDTEVLNLSKEI